MASRNPSHAALSTREKQDFPLTHIRQLLEPGPIVLVSSAWKGEENIMTMGWHLVMEFSPALIGCVIAASNHSFEMIRRSRACVINVPSADMARTVTAIGNSSGEDIDKFDEYHLTRAPAQKVKVPMIAECFANLECRLADSRLINKYNFFIFEVVKAHIAPRHALKQNGGRAALPQTLHYHGQGIFTTDGKVINHARFFEKWRDTATF